MTVQQQSNSLQEAQRVHRCPACEGRGDQLSEQHRGRGRRRQPRVAHVRMDGAWIGSVDISINKAFTSRAFDIATGDLATNSQPGDQFFGIHASNRGRVMVFAGGIPLKVGSQIAGAVGVSGGTGAQDQTIAEASAAAI